MNVNEDNMRRALIEMARSAMDAAPDEEMRKKMYDMLVDNAVDAIERAALGVAKEAGDIDTNAGIEITVLVNGAVRVAQLAVTLGLAMHDLDKSSDEDLQGFVDTVQEHFSKAILFNKDISLREEAARARKVFEDSE